MSDTVKVIIEIPKKVFEARKIGEISPWVTVPILDAVQNGTPLDDVKAVSVPERGGWVYVGDGGGFLNVECWKEYNCSLCGRRVRLGRRKDLLTEFPFCHCGADMRGKAE